MKFTCNKDRLTQALAYVMPYATYATGPKKVHWLEVEVVGDDLTLRTSNRIVYTEITIPVLGMEDGRAIIDGRLFTANIQSMDPKDIHVSGKKRLRIKQGDKDRRVSTANDDAAPVPPTIGSEVEVAVNLATLLDAMRSVEFARAGKDATGIASMALMCYYLDADTGYLFTADGFRMAYCAVDVPLVQSLLFPPGSYKVLTDLRKAAHSGPTTVTIRCTPPGWVEYRIGNGLARVASMGDTYPVQATALARSLPDTPGGVTVVVNKADLLATLKLAMMYASVAIEQGAGSAVQFTLQPPDRLGIFIEVSSMGEMSDVLFGTVAGDQERTVLLNPQLLYQAAQAAPEDTIRLTVWSPSNHVLLRCYSYDWAVVQAPMGDREVARQYEQDTGEDDDGDF